MTEGVSISSNNLGINSILEATTTINLCSDCTYESAIKSATAESIGSGPAHESVYESIKPTISNLIGPGSAYESAIKSVTADLIGYGSAYEFIKPTIANLTPPKIDISKDIYLNYFYPQIIIPTNPIPKSKKTNDASNLYLEMLSIVCDQHADNSLNRFAYESLFELEVSLRNLIQTRIIEPNKGNLKNYIPKEMLDYWITKKTNETKNSNSSEDDSDLIEYSDFTDLKQIFEKGKNKNLVKDIIPEEKLKTIISKLQELDPIRKKIAHSRAITKNDIYRLVLYQSDILRMIKI
ncbi:hypothetical protein LLG34_06315 [bacterium]|nr:hypothetical protein [bacterium]